MSNPCLCSRSETPCWCVQVSQWSQNLLTLEHLRVLLGEQHGATEMGGEEGAHASPSSGDFRRPGDKAGFPSQGRDCPVTVVVRWPVGMVHTFIHGLMAPRWLRPQMGSTPSPSLPGLLKAPPSRNGLLSNSGRMQTDKKSSDSNFLMGLRRKMPSWTQKWTFIYGHVGKRERGEDPEKCWWHCLALTPLSLPEEQG